MWANDEIVDHGIYRRLAPNDKISFIISGGGGYGDPLSREPERVLKDVKQGYVSIEKAKTDYGVVIRPDTIEVDLESTKLLRKEKS